MTLNIYNIKNLILFLFAGILFFSATGCKRNFADINTNPYLLTEELAKRDGFNQGGFFLNLQSEVIPIQENRFQFVEHMVGFPYGRYLPPLNNWGGTNFQTFNPSAAWNSSPFNDAYSQVYPPFFEILRMTNGEGVNFAWAKILRVASMQRVTDMYGPIPYSQIKPGQLDAPYDSQETAYKTMIKDLTDAVAELQKYIAASGNAKPLKSYDNVYDGDFSKWVKFANSLKLRMAIRMSYADPAAAKTAAEEAVNSGVMSDNSDLARIKTNEKNPIAIISGWNGSELGASAEMVSFMKGYNDARLPKYLNPVSVNGVSDFWGTRACMTMNLAEKNKVTSLPNVGKDDPLLWMPASEVAFLRAEGALKGWAMGGTAQDFYETGIKLSFAQWGAANADAYLNNSTSTPAGYTDPLGRNSAAAISTVTIKWNETATAEQKLERIITQKWIAMYPLGLEAWSDFRRTGYPKFFPAVNNFSSDGVNSSLGARRLVFPSTEYQRNAKNVQAAVPMLKGGKDAQSTNLWWDAKN